MSASPAAAPVECPAKDQLVKRLVALPPVQQAPLPDTSWYDAIIVRTGPVNPLKQAVFNDQTRAEIYLRAVRPMLDAGHEA